ncbi:carbon-nitrogen hydrolase family protein [bacterium]|nr:carbon-nitrogen hydrolase family protein [bacterium]
MDSFQTGAAELPSGWSTAARLAAFPPQFSVVAGPSLGAPGALCIRGAGQEAASGCWRTELKGIDPSQCYEFEAWFQARGVPWPRRQAMARLDWLDESGQRVTMPDEVPQEGGEGDWQRVHVVCRPPEKAAQVRVELFLSHCPQGEIYWDRVSLRRVAEPQPRKVRVAAADYRPSGVKTNLEAAGQYDPLIDQAGAQGCDILLLGETITLPGRADVPTLQKAESVPGPLSEHLSALARKHKMYIIVGILENDHGVLYNTALLIDRQGQVAGRYRKVHLPLDDLEGGVTPGDSYPVFDTDFGRIGIMICYDLQFPEPSRAMTIQGAEVLFCPNWGSDFPPAGRALENQVYVVSSGYDTPTDIVGPDGKVLARSEKKPGLAVAEIDLNRGLREPGFARRRQYLLRELRPDIIIPGYNR